LLNRNSPGDSITVEKSTNGWNWNPAGKAAFAVNANMMELKISRSLLGIAAQQDFALDFKWSDNSISDGNIMDFYVNGDAAPGGRFNFAYATETASLIDNNIKSGQKFSLGKNYPNPFNPATIINYELRIANYVELTVYNVLGQKVACLASGMQNAGKHRVVWEGRDESGNYVNSGIYFYRLKTEYGQVETKRMLLIK